MINNPIDLLNIIKLLDKQINNRYNFPIAVYSLLPFFGTATIQSMKHKIISSHPLRGRLMLNAYLMKKNFPQISI